MFADHGFYKRAQITGSDLALAGVASFADIDRLTIFADNLVPHVLRSTASSSTTSASPRTSTRAARCGPGREEREIRACAVHACALLAERTGMTERDIDNALWTRGGTPEYKACRATAAGRLLLRREPVRVERREVDERLLARRTPAPGRGR